ncbi:hypothetical protein ZOSMA_115G00360 [Zostera marina]|uniref:Serine--tRNA ligase n=1 Tax=Zostera marina TaxID=29655 RepID=A0A0K9Q4K6_ZOSMR|nr:hypothetical protein ZOSMA_115G00360 [Zostera marina]
MSLPQTSPFLLLKFELDGLRKEFNKINKGIAQLKIENNAVVRSFGEKRVEEKLKNHVELVELLDIADLIKGANIAGGRGYYLKGAGARLNMALIQFALDFLESRNYEAILTPFFMRKDIMAKCAQLSQFDELYKPLCAYHLGDRLYPSDVPKRYAGTLTCFRTETGSHGRDTLVLETVEEVAEDWKIDDIKGLLGRCNFNADMLDRKVTL